MGEDLLHLEGDTIVALKIRKIGSLSLISFVLLLSLLLPSGQNASAANVDVPLDEELVSTEFDLTKLEKQEVTYVNENGEKVVHGIEPIIEDTDKKGVISPLSSTKPIQSGNSTWKIYWYVGTANMSFNIDVYRSGTSARITNAYNLSIILIGYSENNRSFTWGSNKAEYTGTAVLFNAYASLPLRLTAEIKGTNLVTSAQA